MNIIKFKDIIDEGHNESEWYNDNLRGKYAYWVRCRYVIPLDSIPSSVYVSYETTINNLLGYTYYYLIEVSGVWMYRFIDDNDLSENQKASAVLVGRVPEHPAETDTPIIKTYSGHTKYVDMWDDDYKWLALYIDAQATDKVNDITECLNYNECTPQELTIDQLKVFRTWLAESLLQYKSDLTDNQRHVLSYYAGGMTDDTVKWLTEFGGVTTNYTDITKSSCGCVGGGSNVSSLYNTSLSVCDPIAIYKKNLHDNMVQLFSDISFWNSINKNLLRTIVIYIEGIVNSGLSLVPYESTLSDTFTCKCLSDDGAAQKLAVSILENLIESFNYIIDDDMDGHKLTVQRALFQWADKLYEVMEWI